MGQQSKLKSRTLLPEKPASTPTKLPSDPNSIEAKVMDFIGGLLGLSDPMDPAASTSTQMGGLGGALSPVAGMTMLKQPAMKLIQGAHDDLPEIVRNLMKAFMDATPAEGISYRNFAVKEMLSRPDELKTLQSRLGEILGPEFTVHRGTSSMGKQNAQVRRGDNRFSEASDPRVERARSFSLSPHTAFTGFARPLTKSMTGKLTSGTATPDDIILPGLGSELELILDPANLTNVRTKEFGYAPFPLKYQIFDSPIKPALPMTVQELQSVSPGGGFWDALRKSLTKK